jgi:RimJ/RimL family protein N-acetyltransferase
MRRDDVARQHEFDQDLGLYGLDCELPRVSPIESAQAFYEARTRSDPDSAPFAIEADGKYIGSCSLKGLQNKHASLELGIGIGDRTYWGRGYGREATLLLLELGFKYLGARRIGLTTHARNERAIRCYLACGFVEDGRPRQALWIEGEYVDLVDMSILRDEWEAARSAATGTATAATGTATAAGSATAAADGSATAAAAGSATAAAAGSATASAAAAASATTTAAPGSADTR